MKLTAFVLTVISVLFLFSCQQEPFVNVNKEVVVTSFSPDSGQIGTVVTVRGKGFDTAWARLSVKVNGINAQLLSVNDSLMTIKILPGTTSGKITVTLNNQTFTSTKDFVVLGDTLAITSFSPDSGKVDTEITIRGVGFDPLPAGNAVTINHTAATVLSSSDTVLVIRVQAGATTGKIAVSAGGKSTISSRDFVVVEAGWVQKADFPQRWQNIMTNGNGFINGFSAGDKGYFFKSNQLWAYDPAQNAWSRKANLPSAQIKNFCFSFVCDGKAYVGLGAPEPGLDMSAAAESKEVWAYDPGSDQWTRKKDFPGTARVVPFSFSINNKGYVGGGDTTNYGFGPVRDFWMYDPQADTWRKQGDFPGTNMVGITGFAIGSSGFVLEAGPGNPTAPVSGSGVAQLWRYDPVANTWTQKATFPVNNVISATAFSVHQKGYVAVGTMANNGTAKDDFWEYDPVANQWTKKADVGGGIRWFGSSFSIGNKGYVGVGNGNTIEEIKTDFWAYTF